MAKEVLRKLDTARNAEVVILEDELGNRHELVIYLDTSERCPTCGRLRDLQPSGEVDVEAETRKASDAIDARAEKLKQHALRRGYDVAKLKKKQR